VLFVYPEHWSIFEDMSHVNTFKRLRFLFLGACLLGAILWFAGPKLKKTWRIANPVTDQLSLPESLVELQSPIGQMRLKESLARADYAELSKAFEAQIYLSYCGVASGVVVSNALGAKTRRTQSNWFDGRPEGTRTQFDTFYGGMTLGEFEAMVRSDSFRTQRHHGGAITLSDFRRRVIANLKNVRDTLVVNYSRKGLQQKGGGHFSPLAAYHQTTDSVLILDVAAHKYPPVWAPLRSLWLAMDTMDSDSGKTRGFVEITGL
jgi:hypothetical protein